MAREIKFRAKVKYPANYHRKRLQEYEWVEGDLHLRSMCPHIHTDLLTKYPIDTNTICEFTGAWDKYGTPIYEGDKVRFHLHDRFADEPEFQDGFVVFEDGQFFARLKCSTHNLAVCNGKDYEVVGNKFDD